MLVNPPCHSPDFGGDGTPSNLEHAEYPTRQVLMQDRVHNLPSAPFGMWRYNHGETANTWGDSADMTSATYYAGGSPGVIHGANILFFDLSVQWVPMQELKHAGNNRWSVLPDIY